MDQINSNPFSDTARLYPNTAAPQKQSGPAATSTNQNHAISSNRVNTADTDFSSLFDDDALLKLQGNLEAIALMAEKSLQQIDGKIGN